MKSFIFTSGDTLNKASFNSLLSFDDNYDEWFDVVLDNQKELLVLFDLLGINNVVESELQGSEDFEKIYDYSSCKLPEFTIESFDEFYELWLKKTDRETSMDEYGQLIFIHGHASNWNCKNHRFVLQTSHNNTAR